MKSNKMLKIFSVIFECSTIGSIVLYVYNFYTATKKYEIIPVSIRNSLNMFMIIAIISLIVFLIIKYVLYLRNRTNGIDNVEVENVNSIEDKVIERVIIHKDEYEVPKERRVLCPNCNNIIDKNAFICLKCGYLLKEAIKEKVVEKHIYNNETNNKNYKNIDFTDKKIKNILINGSLILGIVICLSFIIKIAIERGIIG